MRQQGRTEGAGGGLRVTQSEGNLGLGGLRWDEGSLRRLRRRVGLAGELTQHLEGEFPQDGKMVNCGAVAHLAERSQIPFFLFYAPPSFCRRLHPSAPLAWAPFGRSVIGMATGRLRSALVRRQDCAQRSTAFGLRFPVRILRWIDIKSPGTDALKS